MVAAVALKAVLFDLDDTLWYQAEPPDYAIIQAQQVECVRPLMPPLLPGVNLATLIANFWREWTPAFRALDNDPELHELDSPAFLHQFLSATGARVSAGLARDIWNAMDVPKIGFAVCDDLLETLERIRIRNIRNRRRGVLGKRRLTQAALDGIRRPLCGDWTSRRTGQWRSATATNSMFWALHARA